MWRNFYLLILLIICSVYSFAQINDSVFSAATLSSAPLLNASNNQQDNLLKTASGKPQLFIFLSPECPLCKNYAATLNALYQQFKDSIAFYAIVPGKSYSAAAIKTFKTTYQIYFPVLIDSSKQVSNYLQATVTPQVILLDEKLNLLYKGAIDNWAVSLGKQRLKPTDLYLQDALTASLQHQPAAVKRTKAIGCKINDY